MTKKILSFASLVLAVAAILLFALLPMVVQEGSLDLSGLGLAINAKSTTTWAGFSMIFGGTLKGVNTYVGSISGTTVSNVEIQKAGVNIMALIAFIVLVLGVCVFILSVAAKKKDKKLLKVLGSVLMIAGGVLMFFVVNSTAKQMYTANGREYDADGVANYAKALKLGVGSIIGAICGILAGLTGVASEATK